MVSSDRSKVLAAAGLAPALFLGLMLLSQLWNSHCSFREAAPNVFVCKQRLFSYQLQNVLLRVPTRQGIWPLKRLVNRWVLVDAGAPNTWLFGAHGRGLTKAVLAKLRPAKRGDASGQLDLIIVTHAHAVGALPQLLARYPGAILAAHSEELSFLMGTPPLAPDQALQPSASVWLAGATGLLPRLERGLDPGRVLELRGEGGDLADAARAAKGKVKAALRWLPPGVLRYVHVGAHTPGSIAVIHGPSGTLLPGDALAPRRRWFGDAALSVAPVSSAGRAAQEAEGRALVMNDTLDWSWLLPLHGGNVSRERARQLVANWPLSASLQHGAAGEAQHGGPSPGTDSRDTAAAGVVLSPDGGRAGVAASGPQGSRAGSGGQGSEF